jgi:hypothetical protein
MLDDLPGTVIPARPFTIDAEEDARFCAIVGDAPAGDGTAHPLWGYLLSRRAIAMSLEDLLALADFRVEDGPLLASFDLTLDGPLHVGATYDTEIAITAAERKRGRSGTFDLLTLTHAYRDEAGAPAGRYDQQYALPRAGA